MNGIRNFTAFATLIALTGAVVYQQLVAGNPPVTVANMEPLSREVLAEMEQMTADRLELERYIEDAQARLARNAGTLAALAAEAEEARLRVEPDFDTFKARGLEVLQSTLPRGQATQTSLVEQREANQDLHKRMAMTLAQAQYSAQLDALGITGARREHILQTIADTTVTADMMTARRAEGLITQEELDAHSEEYGVDAVLSRLFSADELEATRHIEQERNAQMLLVGYRRGIALAAPELPDEINQLAAQTIHRNMGDPADLPSDPADAVAVRVRALQAAQSELAAQLDTNEQRQVQAYFDRQLIYLERQARAMARQHAPELQ